MQKTLTLHSKLAVRVKCDCSVLWFKLSVWCNRALRNTLTRTYAGISAASGSTWGLRILCWSRSAGCSRTEWSPCCRCTGWLNRQWNGDQTAPACCAPPFLGLRKTPLDGQRAKEIGYLTFLFSSVPPWKRDISWTQLQKKIHADVYQPNWPAVLFCRLKDIGAKDVLMVNLVFKYRVRGNQLSIKVYKKKKPTELTFFI